jgi:hypothetical protein
MTMSGANGPYEMTGIESIEEFTPPFSVSVTVESTVAHGNPFAMFLVGPNLGNQVYLFGNTNASSGYFGIWVGSSQWFSQDQLLYSAPESGIWYTVTLTVNSNGATANLSSGGVSLGTAEGIRTGAESYALVLGQFEGSPYAVGVNSAEWGLVSLEHGTAPATYSLGPRESPSLAQVSWKHQTAQAMPGWQGSHFLGKMCIPMSKVSKRFGQVEGMIQS